MASFFACLSDLNVAIFLVQAALTCILINCIEWARATRSVTHTDKPFSIECLFGRLLVSV